MSQVGASWEDVGHQIVSIVSGCDYDPRRDMHFIDPKSININNWLQSRPGAEKYWMTDNVSSICPHCNQKVVIQLQTFRPIGEIQSLASKGMCPQCREAKPIRVFFVGVKPRGSHDRHCEQIWIDPAPKIRKPAFETLADQLILRTYNEALNTFNQGQYRSSLINCGVIVEQIGRTKFPHVTTGKKGQGGREAKEIKALFDLLRSELKGKPEFKELLKPLLELGEALRLGRNSGGHFNFEHTPTRELAEQVIDLTEFLVRYIYVVAEESSNVNQIISELERKEGREENTEHS